MYSASSFCFSSRFSYFMARVLRNRNSIIETSKDSENIMKAKIFDYFAGNYWYLTLRETETMLLSSSLNSFLAVTFKRYSLYPSYPPS